MRPRLSAESLVALFAAAAIVAAAFVGRYFETPPPSGEVVPAKPKKTSRLIPLKPTDVHPLLVYSLDGVAEAKSAPPVFVDRLAVDLTRILDVDEKKQTFFRIMLPHIARENDRIRRERESIVESPETVPEAMFQKYDVAPGDVPGLLKRVDVVPASLALAQAAIESGWGSSRFAREANNFFGLRTYVAEVPGVKPGAADGFKVMLFTDIGQSVRAYVRTLNTHEAYAGLRDARAELRAEGTAPAGRALTSYLAAYSQIPEKYGAMIRDVIKLERLSRFDGVRLAAN